VRAGRKSSQKIEGKGSGEKGFQPPAKGANQSVRKRGGGKGAKTSSLEIRAVGLKNIHSPSHFPGWGTFKGEKKGFGGLL